MPSIFESVLPLTKEGCRTRSRARSLRNIKRVISNVHKDAKTFEHFCKISLNNRITNLSNNNNSYDPVILNMSKVFLPKHNICEKSSNIYITVNPRSRLKSTDIDRNSKGIKRNSSKKAVNTTSNLSTCNKSFTKNTKVDEDDVIIVNSQNDSVIVIDDSSSHLPCMSPKTKSPKCNSDQSKFPVRVSTINILDDADEDKDIIFIKEETLTTKQLNKEKQERKNKARNLKRANRKKKKRLKEIATMILSSNTISQESKRCAKCINVNAELAKGCDCKRNFGMHTFKINPLKNCAKPVNLIDRPPPLMAVNVFNIPRNNAHNMNGGNRTGLREIVIDGSNVALGHSNGKSFSVKGLQIAIDYFINRGHKVVAFVPQYRQKFNQTTDNRLLNSLADMGYVVFTPSREVNGRRITPYDDRYILEYATACNGIVVSSDNYRDLFMERPEWRATIANRLLMPTWVGDMLMFPQDPLGRHGPNLSRFLKFP